MLFISLLIIQLVILLGTEKAFFRIFPVSFCRESKVVSYQKCRAVFESTEMIAEILPKIDPHKVIYHIDSHFR